MIFDIDAEMVERTISDALENAASRLSEEQFNKIIEAVEAGMPGVIQVIAQGTMEYWKSEARGAGGWGTKYAEAISMRGEGGEAEVYLDEEKADPSLKEKKPFYMFAMMMEEGVDTWSIKDALLKSEKAKNGTDSKGNQIKYITVPFPVRTPKSDKGTKMASQFGGREMTREMYNIVKAGGRIKSGSIMAKGKEVNISGLARYTTPQLHGQYGIFRTVTSNSRGWQYPHIPAEPVYPRVLEKVNEVIQQVLDKFCKEIVREYGG